MSQTSPRFARDIRGAVAVEFALLAPLLLVFYFGMAELTQAMMAQRRLYHTASLIGDLAAQNGQINQAKVDDIYNISLAVMKPFPSTPLRLCISSVVSNTSGANAGKNTVAWSAAKNSPATCPAKGSIVTNIDASVLPSGASVIVSTASYDYQPSIGLTGTKFTFQHTYYLRPRRTETVEWPT